MPRKTPMLTEELATIDAEIAKLKPPKQKFCGSRYITPTKRYLRYLNTLSLLQSQRQWAIWRAIERGAVKLKF